LIKQAISLKKGRIYIMNELLKEFGGKVPYESLKPGGQISFNKSNGEFTYKDNDFTHVFTMADAVFFAECVIDVLTNSGGMFVAENMKPEFIDMYHKSWDKREQG